MVTNYTIKTNSGILCVQMVRRANFCNWFSRKIFISTYTHHAYITISTGLGMVETSGEERCFCVENLLRGKKLQRYNKKFTGSLKTWTLALS